MLRYEIGLAQRARTNARPGPFLTTALAPRHIERARILAAQTPFTKPGSLAGLF